MWTHKNDYSIIPIKEVVQLILGYNTINKLLKKQKLIERANQQNIRSASFDLTISKYILVFKTPKDTISLFDAEKISNMYDKINISQGYILKPKDTILVILDDEFNIPKNICGFIQGRTSLNRLGIMVFPQILQPGFKGKLNISITNCSNNEYLITPKIVIGQVIFQKLNKKLKNKYTYGYQKNISYQNTNGEQGSMIYTDYIGKVVRHYKGNYYYIEDICIHSETNEYMIIYKPLYETENRNIWARPAKMFFDKIDKNKSGNITKQSHRFEIMTDLNIDHIKK